MASRVPNVVSLKRGHFTASKAGVDGGEIDHLPIPGYTQKALHFIIGDGDDDSGGGGGDDDSSATNIYNTGSGSAIAQQSDEPLPLDTNPFLDALGVIWNLPNTVLGLVLGGLDYIVTAMIGGDPQVNISDNAVQFTNLLVGLNGWGLTLGNVQLYDGSADPDNFINPKYAQDGANNVMFGVHEEAHTFQSEILGVFFLPVYLANGGPWVLSNPFEVQADYFGQGVGGYWP